MNIFNHWLAKLLPGDDYGVDDVSGINKRYKKFRITLLTTMLIISLLPAVITAAIGYFQYMYLLS